MLISVSNIPIEDQRMRKVIADAAKEPIASDACIVIMVDDALIGWGDDYGTFHPMGEIAVSESIGEAILGLYWDVEANA